MVGDDDAMICSMVNDDDDDGGRWQILLGSWWFPLRFDWLNLANAIFLLIDDS